MLLTQYSTYMKAIKWLYEKLSSLLIINIYCHNLLELAGHVVHPELGVVPQVDVANVHLVDVAESLLAIANLRVIIT